MSPRWKDVVVGLLITGLLFGGAEVFLRWKVRADRAAAGKQLLTEAAEERARGTAREVQRVPLNEWAVPDPFVGFKPRANFVLNGAKVINSYGFVGPEFSAEKDPGKFRIVAMGDSVTHGLLFPPCSWPGQLQRQLDAMAPGRYEVINGGVEGYGTWHVLQRLRYDVVQLKPDMLIVHIGWNDLWAYNPNDRKQVANPLAVQELKDSWYNRVVLKSYVMKWLTRQALRVLAARHQGPAQASQLERYRAFVPVASIHNYRGIVEAAKAGGIRYVVLATQPSVAGGEHVERYRHLMHFPTFAQTPELFTVLWERYSAAIRLVAHDEGAILLDMAEVFRREVPDSGRHFFDSVHMYCEGYAQFARKMAEQLRRTGALPAR